jgi:phosphopantothenoylcysteine decarboxylase
VLYIIACAAPPAMDVQVLIDLAQQDGWDVCLIATPHAFQWLDVPSLTERTGHPVRHDYKLPGEPDVLPSRMRSSLLRRPSTPSTSGPWGSLTPWRLGCCVRRPARACPWWRCPI